jgi:hypothetical protein
MTVLVCALCWVLGVVVGCTTKGININITHKHEQPEPKKQEYNESMAKYLPAEVQQYYQQTKGMNKF